MEWKFLYYSQTLFNGHFFLKIRAKSREFTVIQANSQNNWNKNKTKRKKTYSPFTTCGIDGLSNTSSSKSTSTENKSHAITCKIINKAPCWVYGNTE